MNIPQAAKYAADALSTAPWFGTPNKPSQGELDHFFTLLKSTITDECNKAPGVTHDASTRGVTVTGIKTPSGDIHYRYHLTLGYEYSVE